VPQRQEIKNTQVREDKYNFELHFLIQMFDGDNFHVLEVKLLIVEILDYLIYFKQREFLFFFSKTNQLISTSLEQFLFVIEWYNFR
jgi:hypothetical protein